MSLAGSVETTRPVDRVPSMKREPDRRRAVDHVVGGEDRPARVDDHPGAEAGAVPSRPRAARLDLDERRQDLLVDDRRGRRRRAQVLDRLVDDARCDRPDVSTLERGLRRAARRKTEHAEHDRHGKDPRDRDPAAPARAAAPDGRLVGWVAGVASPGSALDGTLGILESRLGADCG